MKIVQINSVCGQGSTGKICVAISKLLSDNGIENYILYSEGVSDYFLAKKYVSAFYIKMQAFFSRIFGNNGFNCVFGTRKLIKILKKIDPDIVCIHNIHGHGVNLKILFSYLKKNNKKVFWTFHDCWAFTGYCNHFDYINCDKWKDKCKNCPQKKEFSWIFDKSGKIFEKKKKLFANLDLTIITPSEWLAGLVKQSFLKEHPVKVINNGIDLSVFKPTESNFREKYNISEDKFILLGVSFGWGIRKGLDVFIRLAKVLDDSYKIVLVGTDNRTDKMLPDNILSIHRTENQVELAKIYTAADVFVNPTREENYPTVNMESLACGTPVITFATGGSAEMIDDNTGIVVPKDDFDQLTRVLQAIRQNNPFNRQNCLEKAKSFTDKNKYEKYLSLYRKQSENEKNNKV